MFVQLPAAAELLRHEVNYLFRHDLIFSSKDFVQMNHHYETEMDVTQTLRLGALLAWGVARGKFSGASFRRLLNVSSAAQKIKTLYRQFPEDPVQFDSWVADVEPLWAIT
jgi:hypothetical protein